MSNEAYIIAEYENGKKQREIARELGVSDAYISQVLAEYKKKHNDEVPEEVKIAWNQVSKSIESAWGKVKKDGTRKWPSKYAHFLIVKKWIESKFN